MFTVIFHQLFAGSSSFPKHSYGLWIVLLGLGIALFVDLRRRKVDRRWLLRPSNILILLGVSFFIYKGLHDPLWEGFYDEGSYSGSGIGTIIITLAFVIRQWEADAVRDVDGSDSDGDAGNGSMRTPP